MGFTLLKSASLCQGGLDGPQLWPEDKLEDVVEFSMDPVCLYIQYGVTATPPVNGDKAGRSIIKIENDNLIEQRSQTGAKVCRSLENLPLSSLNISRTGPAKVNYYEVLHVPPTVDLSQLRAAYKERAMATHPDKPAGSNSAFQQVLEAYTALLDPDLRKEHDQRLGIRSPDLVTRLQTAPYQPSPLHILKLQLYELHSDKWEARLREVDSSTLQALLEEFATGSNSARPEVFRIPSGSGRVTCGIYSNNGSYHVQKQIQGLSCMTLCTLDLEQAIQWHADLCALFVELNLRMTRDGVCFEQAALVLNCDIAMKFQSKFTRQHVTISTPWTLDLLTVLAHRFEALQIVGDVREDEAQRRFRAQKAEQSWSKDLRKARQVLQDEAGQAALRTSLQQELQHPIRIRNRGITREPFHFPSGSQLDIVSGDDKIESSIAEEGQEVESGFECKLKLSSFSNFAAFYSDMAKMSKKPIPTAPRPQRDQVSMLPGPSTPKVECFQPPVQMLLRSGKKVRPILVQDDLSQPASARARRGVPKQEEDQPKPLPTTIPACDLTDEQVAENFRLPTHMFLKEPLKSQWERYAKWATDPINLERQGKACAKSVSSKLVCQEFLGYASKHKGRTPSLMSFLDGELQIDYLAFKRARNNAMSTLAKNFKIHAKVASHLAAVIQDPSARSVAATVISGIRNLIRQLDSQVPGPKSVEHFEANHKWLDEDTLLELSRSLEARALTEAQRSRNKSSASLVMDACLLSFVYGRLPPIRMGVWRTLAKQGKGEAKPECCAEDCNRPDCLGNVLKYNDTGNFEMLITHHKNESRWGRRPLGPITLDSSNVGEPFCQLLTCAFDWAHNICAPIAEAPNLFVCSQQGKPWQRSALSQKLVRLVNSELQVGGYPKKQIGFTMLRRIFVESCRKDGVNSDFEVGAAMVMGNTRREWNRTYDLKFKQRTAQNAISSLALRRQGGRIEMSKVQPTEPRRRLSHKQPSAYPTTGNSDNIDQTTLQPYASRSGLESSAPVEHMDTSGKKRKHLEVSDEEVSLVKSRGTNSKQKVVATWPPQNMHGAVVHQTPTQALASPASCSGFVSEKEAKNMDGATKKRKYFEIFGKAPKSGSMKWITKKITGVPLKPRGASAQWAHPAAKDSKAPSDIGVVEAQDQKKVIADPGASAARAARIPPSLQHALKRVSAADAKKPAADAKKTDAPAAAAKASRFGFVRKRAALKMDGASKKRKYFEIFGKVPKSGNMNWITKKITGALLLKPRGKNKKRRPSRRR